MSREEARREVGRDKGHGRKRDDRGRWRQAKPGAASWSGQIIILKSLNHCSRNTRFQPQCSRFWGQNRQDKKLPALEVETLPHFQFREPLAPSIFSPCPTWPEVLEGCRMLLFVSPVLSVSKGPTSRLARLASEHSELSCPQKERYWP